MTSIKQEDFPYRNIIYKNKKEVKIESIKPLKKLGKTKKKGTKITFLPSKEIFSSIKFNKRFIKVQLHLLI